MKLREFIARCEDETGERFRGYLELQEWATREYPRFWELFLRWSGLAWQGSSEPAITEADCESGRFFPNVRLNYARNILRELPGQEDHEALVGIAEDGARSVLTRRELRAAVERFAFALAQRGVGPGDRVVAVARNTPETVVACLGTTALGALWSSVSPDIGDAAALERFSQLKPKLLVAHRDYVVHGVRRSLEERIGALRVGIPSLEGVIALDGGLGGESALPMERWREFPFNHPLFVLFSSGTTGAPKCLVHGAGGTLLEHYKEHVLHSGFGPGEKLLFQTSAGWMMWNWQLSALACGTAIVVFDGSPTYPTPDALPRALDRERVSVFGTSATYLHALQQLGIEPREVGRLERLHTIQSTGSILYDSQFDWIGSAFGPLKIQSISGGTDIVGCFVLGNPLLPVRRGESQCVSLGLDVRVMTPEGLHRHGEGELVCVNPFPSRPVAIYGDTDGSRLHQAYYSQNPGMWTHGDRVRLDPSGSARILGRSDGTLNVRGVRIGPAEIYSIVLQMPEVLQALAIEQRAPREPGGSRMVLLLVLKEGVRLDRALTLRIKKELSTRASPNHVPAVVAQVSALPVTHSGKLSEKAAREALEDGVASNRGALRNPEVLEEIARHPELSVP